MTSLKDSGAYVTIKYGQNQFDTQSPKYRTCFDRLHISFAVKVFIVVELIFILGIIIFALTQSNLPSAWLTLMYSSPILAILLIGAVLFFYGLRRRIRYYFLPHVAIKIIDTLGLLVILGILLLHGTISLEKRPPRRSVENYGLGGRLCEDNENSTYCATTFKVYVENGQIHSSVCKIATAMIVLNSIRFFYGLWVTWMAWRLLSEWSMSADHCNGIACERGYESKFIGEKCVCCRKSWYKACSEASSWPLQCPTGYSKETHLGLVKCWKDTPIEQNEHCTADEWRREACSDSICPAGYSCRHFMGQPKCCKQTKAITAADFGVCPHTGLPSLKVCRSDQDCGDCRFTCQNHLCCQRTDTYANNTVAVPTGSCGDEGTCIGGGHVCMDRLCYPIAVVVHSPEGFCPGGFKSQIFCPGNCCPYGMQCVNKVCCK
uniref:Uncharacterized protein n=1 Tax=Romanomermis culicivorax TaxID=13658 RepID=A0A915KCP4_ROMCU